MSDVTKLLHATAQGDQKAAAELIPLVYDALRRLAAAKLAREPAGQTLSGTALVHEVYVRLVGVEDAQHWENRAHFFAAAAEAMRRLLIESARRKRALKHGGDFDRVPLESLLLTMPSPSQDLEALDEALTRFAAVDPEKAELVKMRFFVGLTIEECARVLDISPTTAKRHWTYGRAWLHQEIAGTSEKKAGNS